MIEDNSSRVCRLWNYDRREIHLRRNSSVATSSWVLGLSKTQAPAHTLVEFMVGLAPVGWAGGDGDAVEGAAHHFISPCNMDDVGGWLQPWSPKRFVTTYVPPRSRTLREPYERRHRRHGTTWPWNLSSNLDFDKKYFIYSVHRRLLNVHQRVWGHDRGARLRKSEKWLET